MRRQRHSQARVAFRPVICLAVLWAALATALAQDLGRWQWQRTVRPAAVSPAAEQCVLVDADLYTKAAPGLRDLRLLQDGRELAYALQESYDAGALDSHAPARMLADRSLYTTVLRIPLNAAPTTQSGAALLFRHVPVERMELVPSGGSGQVHFRLLASPTEDRAHAGQRAPAEPEVIDDELSAASPVEITALGANLQNDASVAIAVDGGARFSEVLLQMHQRSICYQPLSRSPLVLLFGNPDARPVHYSYATNFHPVAKPLLAIMGPTEPNPAYRRTTPQHLFTRQSRLMIALVVGMAAFLLTALPLLRRFV